MTLLDRVLLQRSDEQCAEVGPCDWRHENDSSAIVGGNEGVKRQRVRHFCRIQRCGRFVASGGLCSMHSQRAKRGTLDTGGVR